MVFRGGFSTNPNELPFPDEADTAGGEWVTQRRGRKKLRGQQLHCDIGCGDYPFFIFIYKPFTISPSAVEPNIVALVFPD